MTRERVSYDLGNVRVVNRGDPRDMAFDVMVQRMSEGAWRDARGFNSFSDDYAHTNARDYAKSLQSRMTEDAS